MDEARFWRRVDARGPDDCWEWRGVRSDRGYGITKVTGRRERAHRVSFRLAFGWSPEAVLHKCDNPPCVNPRHLFGGTQALNMIDKAAKWRSHGKVTPAVRSTIFALSECGMTQRAIGRQTNLAHTTVGKVLRHERRTAPEPGV